MAAVYRTADVCLVPSVCREGMSMVVQEALASGLPVIGTACGAIPEMVAHEFNGLLCAPERLFVEGLHAIERLMRDESLRETLSVNARRYAQARLARQRCLENFDRFFTGDYLSIDADLSYEGFLSPSSHVCRMSAS
jgi:glycosyltransferase involved in cell wall biosynthesis